MASLSGLGGKEIKPERRDYQSNNSREPLALYPIVVRRIFSPDVRCFTTSLTRSWQNPAYRGNSAISLTQQSLVGVGFVWKDGSADGELLHFAQCKCNFLHRQTSLELTRHTCWYPGGSMEYQPGIGCCKHISVVQLTENSSGLFVCFTPYTLKGGDLVPRVSRLFGVESRVKVWA